MTLYTTSLGVAIVQYIDKVMQALDQPPGNVSVPVAEGFGFSCMNTIWPTRISVVPHTIVL